jgi:acyl dehydratase
MTAKTPWRLVKNGEKFMPAREITSVEELRSLTGREVAVSDWFEVTQDRINLFADATGDHQWIHVDVERAKAESPYETTIAHGFLTLSLLSQLMSETVKIKLPIRLGINYGLNKVRFPSAVPAGSKVRARAVLQSLEAIEGGQQLVWNITVEREGGGKPCCVAEWLVRHYTQ